MSPSLSSLITEGEPAAINVSARLPYDGKIGDDLIESPALPHLGEAIEYLRRKD